MGAVVAISSLSSMISSSAYMGAFDRCGLKPIIVDVFIISLDMGALLRSQAYHRRCFHQPYMGAVVAI